MSRWLKSTTQKQWVINGKIIPKCVTPHNDYLCVSDTEYNQMLAKPVFKSLVASNGILVLTKEPAELKNSIEGLTTSNAELVAQVTELQEENKKLKAEINTLKGKVKQRVEEEVASFKEEALKELQEKQDALEEARKKLEAYEKKAEK